MERLEYRGWSVSLARRVSWVYKVCVVGEDHPATEERSA